MWTLNNSKYPSVTGPFFHPLTSAKIALKGSKNEKRMVSFTTI